MKKWGRMMNVFYNTLVFVKDIAKSKEFYRDVIGIKIETEYETIIFFENHFTIHDAKNLLQTIFGDKPKDNTLQGRRNIDIYFESDDIQESYRKVKESGTEIIHGIKEQAWGQNVFRFFDPDGHIVEIGEAMHLDYLKK